MRITLGDTNYDVTADGKRFLMNDSGGATSVQLNIVVNWFDELKRLVPREN